ncbi:hypothetical protein CapIbe_011215 [Capra ibex]
MSQKRKDRYCVIPLTWSSQKEPSPPCSAPKATLVWNRWDCLTYVLLPLDTELPAGNAAHFLHPLQHVSPGLFLTTRGSRAGTPSWDGR